MKFDIIDNLKNMKIQYKITIISTFIFGLLSQGMGIFNKYSYSDDIGYGFSNLGSTIPSGRWMLEIISKIDLLIFGDGHYGLPIINGFIVIVLVAISACILVSLFEINNKTLCACIAGIMIAFPSITGMFGYIFTVPSYMFGLLLSVFGAYLVCKNNDWKIIIGIVLMGCSVGIYQAFIPIILGIFVIYLIRYCVLESNNTKLIIKEAIKIFISVISFILFYFLVNKAVLSISGIELTTYQGINTMGKDSLSDYISRIVYAYGRFFILNDNSKYYMFYGNIKYLYYFILIISSVLMVLLFVKLWKINKANSIILLCLFACIPLASNFIFVMVDPDQVHALMVYGQIIPYILAVVLLDNDQTNNQLIKYISVIGTIALLLINIMYCRFDNQCYLYAELSQQETISYFTTLVTRIKSCDKYDDELPVSFVFIDGSHIEDKSIYDSEYLNHIKVNPYDDMYHYVNNYEWKTFMKRWCGYSPEIVNGSDLMNNQEVLEMPCYPDADSIKVVDNRVVVKFR